jgi:septal ring-binding cell division protein DamX
MNEIMKALFGIVRPNVFQYTLLIIVFPLLESSCVAQKPTGSAVHEDLSVYRPKFADTLDTVRTATTTRQTDPVVPTKNVNAKIDAVLDSIDRFNLTKKFVDGFTIQIYSGQKREEAMNTKQKMNSEITDLTANLQYVQPKFRVTVGSYFNKLDAQKDLSRLKRHFSTAILVPEKIPIK